MLTKRQLEILDMLCKSEDREIVCDGRHCMIDLENISRKSVYALLGHMAIKDAGYASAGCDIYKPSLEAEKIVRRPALADEMVARVIMRKPFYVDDDGNIQDSKA